MLLELCNFPGGREYLCRIINNFHSFSHSKLLLQWKCISAYRLCSDVCDEQCVFESKYAWWMTVCRRGGRVWPFVFMLFQSQTRRAHAPFWLWYLKTQNENKYVEFALSWIRRQSGLSGLFLWKTFPFKHFLHWEVHKTAQLRRVSPQANIVTPFSVTQPLTLQPFESQQGVISRMNM